MQGKANAIQSQAREGFKGHLHVRVFLAQKPPGRLAYLAQPFAPRIGENEFDAPDLLGLSFVGKAKSRKNGIGWLGGWLGGWPVPVSSTEYGGMLSIIINKIIPLASQNKKNRKIIS